MSDRRAALSSLEAGDEAFSFEAKHAHYVKAQTHALLALVDAIKADRRRDGCCDEQCECSSLERGGSNE